MNARENIFRSIRIGIVDDWGKVQKIIIEQKQNSSKGITLIKQVLKVAHR